MGTQNALSRLRARATDLSAVFAKEPYWTRYRSISNTPAARAVILVPLVGYWIIFNDYLVCHYTDLSRILVWKDTPAACDATHIPWRLFATYFGLVLVAIASGIYQALCPEVIKLYATGTEYVGRVAPDISTYEMARVEGALREGDSISMMRYDQLTEPPSPVRTLGPEELRDRRAVQKRNMLTLHYDLCNRSSRMGRRIMARCYAVGFAVLLLPAVDIFCRVVSVLLRALGRALFGAP